MCVCVCLCLCLCVCVCVCVKSKDIAVNEAGEEKESAFVSLSLLKPLSKGQVKKKDIKKTKKKAETSQA